MSGPVQDRRIWWVCAVTMSIRRMTLGEGYKYLLASVALGDGAPHPADNLARDYAESGTPPGRFAGAGLAGLAGGSGVAAGSEVSEEQLFRMLGMLQDPLSGAPLGRLPIATVNGRDGAAARRPVAGFDLTFSVPKSVSVLWALGDAKTQQAIHRAHVQAILFVRSYAEQHVFFSGSGRGGVVREDNCRDRRGRDAGRAVTGPSVPSDVLADLDRSVEQPGRLALSKTQAAAVHQIATAARTTNPENALSRPSSATPVGRRLALLPAALRLSRVGCRRSSGRRTPRCQRVRPHDRSPTD
jgi:hypothetical protein